MTRVLYNLTRINKLVISDGDFKLKFYLLFSGNYLSVIQGSRPQHQPNPHSHTPHAHTHRKHKTVHLFFYLIYFKLCETPK